MVRSTISPPCLSGRSAEQSRNPEKILNAGIIFLTLKKLAPRLHGPDMIGYPAKQVVEVYYLSTNYRAERRIRPLADTKESKIKLLRI